MELVTLCFDDQPSVRIRNVDAADEPISFIDWDLARRQTDLRRPQDTKQLRFQTALGVAVSGVAFPNQLPNEFGSSPPRTVEQAQPGINALDALNA